MSNLKEVGEITIEELRSDITWLEDNKVGCCYHKVAETEGGTILAIVVGWHDGYEKAPVGTPCADGSWRICAKIAYQHSNNAMQSDFDLDWLMPYGDNGDCDDTTCEVVGNKGDVTYLNNEAKRMWKTWRNKLDTLE